MSFIKTSAAVLAALSLVACDTEAPADLNDAQLPVDQAAPPGQFGLDLTVDGALIPGSTLTFRVSGAQPNETVRLVRGNGLADPPVVCPAPLGGLCLDLTGPTLMPSMTADAQGRAQRSITVPSNIPAGRVVYFQAATTGATAATSLVVPKFNLLPAGSAQRTLGFIVIEDAIASPGVSYEGVRTEIYYSNALSAQEGIYLDVCSLDISQSATGLGALQPCPACDWAFEVEHTSARDSSIAGDCLDMGLIDPAAVQPFSFGRGYAASYYVAGYGDVPSVMFYDDTNLVWSAYVFSTAGTQLWDPTTEVMNWGVDFGVYWPY